jgi:hypothetical protein
MLATSHVTSHVGDIMVFLPSRHYLHFRRQSLPNGVRHQRVTAVLKDLHIGAECYYAKPPGNNDQELSRTETGF